MVARTCRENGLDSFGGTPPDDKDKKRLQTCEVWGRFILSGCMRSAPPGQVQEVRAGLASRRYKVGKNRQQGRGGINHSRWISGALCPVFCRGLSVGRDTLQQITDVDATDSRTARRYALSKGVPSPLTIFGRPPVLVCPWGALGAPGGAPGRGVARRSEEGRCST